MSGWIVIAALALLTAAALWPWMRRDAGGLQFLGAALLLALAGYAWQGRPGLAGAPKAAQAEAPHPPSEFALLRGDLLGPADGSTPALTAAEAQLSRGESKAAADGLREAIAAAPRDYRLWLGLADALVQHGDDRIGPAAELAFQRAAVLAPEEPAPIFFYAVALAKVGQFDAASSLAGQIVTADPRWRDLISRLQRGIEQARAGAGASGPPAP